MNKKCVYKSNLTSQTMSLQEKWMADVEDAYNCSGHGVQYTINHVSGILLEWLVDLCNLCSMWTEVCLWDQEMGYVAFGLNSYTDHYPKRQYNLCGIHMNHQLISVYTIYISESLISLRFLIVFVYWNEEM